MNISISRHNESVMAFTPANTLEQCLLLKISQMDDEGARIVTINKRDAHFVQVCETEDEIIFRLVPKKEDKQ